MFKRLLDLQVKDFSWNKNTQPVRGVCHFLYWRNGHTPKETLEQTRAKRPEAGVSLLLHQTRQNRAIPKHYSLTHYTRLFKQALEHKFFLLPKTMHLFQHCFWKYQHIGYSVCICTEHQQTLCFENLPLNLSKEPGLQKLLSQETHEWMLEVHGGGRCREANQIPCYKKDRTPNWIQENVRWLHNSRCLCNTLKTYNTGSSPLSNQDVTLWEVVI